MMLSCGRDVPCPESWEDYNSDDSRCDPPPEVTADAERDLGTGIYGYVLGCYPVDIGDACDCSTELPKSPLTFQLVRLADDGSRSEPIQVEVGRDAVYRARLQPGRYENYDFDVHLADSAGDDAHYFSVAEGEVLFLRATIWLGCA